MLTLRLTRTSPTHHKLEYERSDGSGETTEVETKSFLKHDLAHYALESEAGLKNGFFGLIEQGHTYAELSGKEVAEYDGTEATHIERVVGPLSTFVVSDMSPHDFITAVENLFTSHGDPMPPWLTDEMIENVKERYRQILGEWNSLAFGETLELTFG